MNPSSRNQDRAIITAGEFYLDLIFFDLPHPPQMGEEVKTDNFAFAPGGGAAITAATVARLGGDTRLVTVLGDSPLDAAARQSLERLQVGLDAVRTQSDALSGLSVAVSTRRDRYFLTCPGANRHLEDFLLSEDGKNSLKGTRHVHFALASSRWKPWENLVRSLKQAGATTSWDMGWDPQAAAAPGFESLCSCVDILFFNQMEALHYTQTQRLQDAMRKLAHPHNLVVVKLGRQGAAACLAAGPVEQAGAIHVEAIETTGAGDAFNGGFLTRWLEGASLGECLRAGNVCGGLSTRRPGGVGALPSRVEFEAYSQES